MTQNKNHWYDGWFYDKIIAPNQDRLFGHIKALIDVDSSVIDVGCGTGRLAFSLADKCNSVTGIDLSRRNIDRAELTLIQRPYDNISFQHNSLSEIIGQGNTHFDYAVMSYVIHEINEDERVILLNELSQVADRIIIADYLVTKSKVYGNFMSEVIEFIAGRDHYRNYKTFLSSGGIYYLAKKAGLNIECEMIFQSYNNHIVILTNNK